MRGNSPGNNMVEEGKYLLPRNTEHPLISKILVDFFTPCDNLFIKNSCFPLNLSAHSFSLNPFPEEGDA